MSNEHHPDSNPLGSKGNSNGLAEAREVDPHVCLILTRTTNDNKVLYGPVFKNGSIDASNPFEAFWRLSKDGTREDLNFIERKKGYGVYDCKVIERDGKQIVTASLVAAPLSLECIEEDGCWNCYMDFPTGEKHVLVDRVWVEVTNNWIGVPTVHFVDVIGTHEDKPCVYRIIP